MGRGMTCRGVRCVWGQVALQGSREIPCSWETVACGCGDAGLWRVSGGVVVCPCAAVVVAVVVVCFCASSERCLSFSAAADRSCSSALIFS